MVCTRALLNNKEANDLSKVISIVIANSGFAKEFDAILKYET